MQIGIASNPLKDPSYEKRNGLIRVAEECGWQTVAVDAPQDVFHAGMLDCLAVIGGDGTILRFAKAAAVANVPILGVNLGRIGFLTEISETEFASALMRMAEGTFSIDERMMLCASVNGASVGLCLNDFLLYKSTFSGTIRIDAAVDGKRLWDVFSDGLIASTPTGSTAYCLSAGGPILAPGLDAIAVTPICPHTLHVKPVVSSADADWTFRPLGECFLASDGDKVLNLSENDIVHITRSRETAKLIRLSESNVFDCIREKLS